YEETLKYLVKAEDDLKDSIMVRTRCAPHFLRVASSINPESATLKGATSGCIAGRGYLRISPEGFVTPCPYMPVGKDASNLKDKSLKDILDTDEVFNSLRNPQYHGKCADCEFDDICGGCRARALANSNDLMGEDPWCSYVPKGPKGKKPVSAPLWSAEAGKRLDKVPAFLRSTVKKGVERYAASKGLEEITPELMAELKGKTGR
ncbi:MAG: SPASM domain-containing protein, partial [Deltaproteobacteria bacterium]|nr:SPASM domain-containing protein [Deltaproteobacteria bacterium]